MANYSKKPNRRVPVSSKIHTNDLSVSYCISSFETIILSERHWCKIVHELHLRKTQTMKRFHTILILSICIGLPTALFGQGYVSSEYLSSSSLRDEAGGRFGSGAMLPFFGAVHAASFRETKRPGTTRRMVGDARLYVCLASKRGCGRRAESRPDSEYESERIAPAPHLRTMELDRLVGLRHLCRAESNSMAQHTGQRRCHFRL